MSVLLNCRYVLFRRNLCDIHRIYRTVFDSFLLREGQKLGIHVEENLENSHRSKRRNLWLLSFKTQWFLGINLQPLRKYEWLKNINTNFCNTSNLTVISCDSWSQNGFDRGRIRKEQSLLFSKSADASCLSYICPFKLVLLCSDGLQTPTLTDSTHTI